MQLAGELTKISLPSLIQLLRNGELTGKVCLTQGAHTAFLYVLDGRLIHAETDVEQGRAAMLELFLWVSGTFSFVESDLQSVPHTLAPEEPAEKLIREGLAYLDKKKHLDQLRVTPRTVLQPTGKPAPDSLVYPHLDGITSLGTIADNLNLRRFDYICDVYDLLMQGAAVVVEPAAAADQITLPPWVVSRLKQDNPDISEAIVQMVIWVDRVKCWMYQADADLDQVVAKMSGEPAAPPKNK
jgi:hypothetical protein